MNEKISLLETIRANIKDGELPGSFSLPKYGEDNDPNKIRFADGAMDGIGIYHMGQPHITDEMRQIISDAFKHIDDTEKAEQLMSGLLEKLVPIRAIDLIQEYIIDNAASLDPNTVYAFAVGRLHSSDINMIKLGLIITEIFTEHDEAVKEIIRTLGLSDEFTIFSVFNMMTWENADREIFELAKKVHGWGRIHAVKRLAPETKEIRDWLLEEGVKNDVVPAYSALDVYSKLDIPSMLKEDITDDKLTQIAYLLEAMFDEGPVRGISALEEEAAASMISGFISLAAQRRSSPEICELILTISEDERFCSFTEKCREYLHCEKCREVIGRELENGRGIRLAKAVGIPYKEKIFEHLKSDFNSGCFNCSALVDDDEYREMVVDVFRTSLPLKSMTNAEHFDNYADSNKLACLIQSLREYPLCGTDLVAAAAKIPTVQCRAQALSTIKQWCDIRGCSLQELSGELYRAVEVLKNTDDNEKIKKMITDLGF